MLCNGAPDFGDRVEEPVVQVDDIEADSDEFEAVFDRDRDPDFLTVEYDSLLLHNKPRGAPHGSTILEKWNKGFTTRQIAVVGRYRIETRSRTRCTIAKKRSRTNNVIILLKRGQTTAEYRRRRPVISELFCKKRSRETSSKQLIFVII